MAQGSRPGARHGPGGLRLARLEAAVVTNPHPQPGSLRSTPSRALREVGSDRLSAMNNPLCQRSKDGISAIVGDAVTSPSSSGG